MPQESRRPWAWLIFDVGRAMRHSIEFLEFLSDRPASMCSDRKRSGLAADVLMKPKRFATISSLQSSKVLIRAKKPNKAPEPTPTSVMPPANEGQIE